MLGLFFNLHLQNLPQNENLYNSVYKLKYLDLNSDVYNRNMLLYP